ncbi:MAG: DegV family protein, partial [Actinobacteria bacterium]|nr:DegV family protein [Actinomycetota bacterium]
MNKITIITDSTSDLPKTIYKDYDLIVVPLSVVFEGKIYIDNGIDINPEDFYKMIETSVEMPQASQPTPVNFINVYGKLINQGMEVISIHISRKLSGTMNSAEIAARQFKKKSIKVLDSEVVHMPLGFVALRAAKMADRGSTMDEIINEVVDFRKKINSFFLPKSLDNLIKGGRVNKIKGN